MLVKLSKMVRKRRLRESLFMSCMLEMLFFSVLFGFWIEGLVQELYRFDVQKREREKRICKYGKDCYRFFRCEF